MVIEWKQKGTKRTMAGISEFSQAQLEKICSVLADTSDGLSGSEIGRALAVIGIVDPNPKFTKRRRLFNALAIHQTLHRSGIGTATFIHEVMNPIRYTADSSLFEKRRESLNVVLSFCGYVLGEDGKLRVRQHSAKTLSEAEEMAGRLRGELKRRGVHPDVLRFCRPELLSENYFHAVFEATKSVADKIRDKAGIEGDGSILVDKAFGIGKLGMPLLAFNSLQTETEQSEHNGLMQLIKGMFGAFRNTTAHVPRIKWPVSEQDALDLLTIASYIHRRLDGCFRTPRAV